MTTGFPSFREKHGPGRIVAPPVPDRAMLERYRGRLPESLLEEWELGGLGGYMDGFLWLTDPSRLAHATQEWGLGASAVAFARTAFGDLLFWDGEAVRCLFVHEGMVQHLPGDLPWLFEHSFCDESFLEDVLDLALFRLALERLGPPASDEMYTFVPALVLGGEERVENLKKVKMREQLLLLSQLHRRDA